MLCFSAAYLPLHYFSLLLFCCVPLSSVHALRLQKAEVAFRMLSTFMDVACRSPSLRAAGTLQYLLSSITDKYSSRYSTASVGGNVLERILYSPRCAEARFIHVSQRVPQKMNSMATLDAAWVGMNAWLDADVRVSMSSIPCVHTFIDARRLFTLCCCGL